MPIIRSSRVLYKWLLPVVFGSVKMENVICRSGRFCVFGIKCRTFYVFVVGHVGCRGGCVGVLGSSFFFFCGFEFGWFVSVVFVDRESGYSTKHDRQQPLV
jgi:hypothetical protein